VSTPAAEEASGSRLSRRTLLVAGAAGAASAAGVGAGVAEAASASGYPRLKVIQLAKLRPNRAVAFNYPLKSQASVLLDMGHAVPQGVGPKKSIVAYSLFCQHMGCPVEYQAKTREFVCPCHQTRYDPERLGSIIQGLAMTPLPRVILQVKQGAVWAVGVAGLIYGYRNNLHPGKPVGGAK
jgi:arsenite oxidase small subunit